MDEVRIVDGYLYIGDSRGATGEAVTKPKKVKGWTRKRLAAAGEPWPPKAGWLRRLEAQGFDSPFDPRLNQKG